ncbi:MAG: RNA polymerase sigma factor [Chloroflexota bacterium]
MMPATVEQRGACRRTQPATATDETRLIEALRAGDEAAFATLIDQYHRPMVQVALLYVHDPAVAEDVVQETWLGVLRGLDRFETRASLKTWIFSILTNRAKTHAVREARSITFAALFGAEVEPDAPAADPHWFHPAGGYWVSAPVCWDDLPEERLLADETRARIQAALADLPAGQRAVISLRDLDGWSASEVCQVLGISESNQRVLLHRARTRVRQALALYLAAA